MKTLCIIPARLASTRLPRKMLREINGQKLIQKTYLAAKTCQDIDRLVVATDSDEIAAVINEIGGECIMTPDDIQTGTDRVAFAAEQFPEYDIVINLQGDEPFIKASMLTTLINSFKTDPQPVMSTIAHPLDMEKSYNNPNEVKVIFDKNHNALYFGRSPLPYFRKQLKDEVPVLHHIGTYGFQREFLLQFTKMEQTPLEKAEALEQLRALENGYRIRVCRVEESTIEINTPEELELAQQFDQQ